MMIRFIIVVLLAGVSFTSAMAQYGNRIYIVETGIAKADSQQLFLRFRNATFINNKEFFNPYQPGYTLIGYYARPVLEYHPGPNTRLRAGAHLLKYTGMGKFSSLIPVFSFEHSFLPGFDMVFGSLYGSLNHGMVEPLFSFERVFTHHHESGLQFLIDRGIFRADIWVDWETFIFTGDPFQEEFTAGLSSWVVLSGKENRLQVELPLQLLAVHKGGQIDNSDERMQNIVNYAAGIHADLHLDHNFFRTIGFRGYLTFFHDLSNELQYPYRDGRGIYPNLHLDCRWFELGAGYWRGHRFIAPRGEPLFQSISQVDPELRADRRELYTSKIIFDRKLLRGINMGIRFEVYYDPVLNDLDHTGGLHIMIDERFFLTRVRRN